MKSQNYFIPSSPDDEVYVIHSGLGGAHVIKDRVLWIGIDKNGIFFNTMYIDNGSWFVDVFPTEADARQYAADNNIELDD